MPPNAARGTRLAAPLRALIQLVRATAYVALGSWKGAPGTDVRVRISLLGLSHLARRRLPRTEAVDFVLTPMDSVRYFELAFALRACKRHARARRYVDVSSPRILPVLLLRERPSLTADLINPDDADLDATRRLVAACGLTGRARLHAQPIEDADLPPSEYDLATCVSVLEHIPEPRAAIEEIWQALAPDGVLVLSVPCARDGYDEYLDFDEYGLLASDPEGWVFGQRFYDHDALERDIFAVLGAPARIAVFGERHPGTFVAARAARMEGRYDAIREPYVVATSYRRFDSIDELPGIGVVAMEFRRAGDHSTSVV